MNRYPSQSYTAPELETGQNWSTHFDLASWGIEDVAYVKPINVDGEPAYGIFAADGTELTTVENRDEAIVTIRQNELEAHSVH
ncbi:MAG: DUF1150 domain-containing protein [Magnetovibrio sp.]|nr:DUF1150 domain-containing protein [Magnetovibrio sp.]